LAERGDEQLISLGFCLGFVAVWKISLWNGFGSLVFELAVFGFGFQSGSS